MRLWREWAHAVGQLRDAARQDRTWLWVCLILVGFCTRPDLAGATSWVRATFLGTAAYHGVLNVFRGRGVDLDALTRLWASLVGRLLQPVQVTVGPPGRQTTYGAALGDGVTVAKEGRKMPGSKSHYQSSGSNAKAEYVMGHSFQALGLLVQGLLGPVCVFLAARLDSGIKNGPRDAQTCLERFVALFLPLAPLVAATPLILVADAYYGAQSVLRSLLAAGHHVVTRAKSNSVAHKPVSRRRLREKGPGRKPKHGPKVELATCWRKARYHKAKSPVYGDKNVTLRYFTRTLWWAPAGKLCLFVFAHHPTRGRIVLASTLVELDPLDVIRLYGYRWKIEAGFKHAKHTVGVFSYRFWMAGMKPTRRGGGAQYLHGKPAAYKAKVRRLERKYNLHVQLGLVAQGLLQYLAVKFPKQVRRNARTWLRTDRTERTPSEALTSRALAGGLPEFLQDDDSGVNWAKSLAKNADLARLPGIRVGCTCSEP